MQRRPFGVGKSGQVTPPGRESTEALVGTTRAPWRTRSRRARDWTRNPRATAPIPACPAWPDRMAPLVGTVRPASLYAGACGRCGQWAARCPVCGDLVRLEEHVVECSCETCIGLTQTGEAPRIDVPLPTTCAVRMHSPTNERLPGQKGDHRMAQSVGGSRRGTLSRRVVLQAGLELVDESGLGALTMRRVAERLNVEAMSLYTWVTNRDGLLDGIVEIVLDQLYDDPEVHLQPTEDWRDFLSRLAYGVRRLALRSPSRVSARRNPAPRGALGPPAVAFAALDRGVPAGPAWSRIQRGRDDLRVSRLYELSAGVPACWKPVRSRLASPPRVTAPSSQHQRAAPTRSTPGCRWPGRSPRRGSRKRRRTPTTCSPVSTQTNIRRSWRCRGAWLTTGRTTNSGDALQDLLDRIERESGRSGK